MNWYVITATFIVLIGLVLFLIARNLKDKKDYEEQVNAEIKNSKDTDGEMEVE